MSQHLRLLSRAEVASTKDVAVQSMSPWLVICTRLKGSEFLVDLNTKVKHAAVAQEVPQLMIDLLERVRTDPENGEELVRRSVTGIGPPAQNWIELEPIVRQELVRLACKLSEIEVQLPAFLVVADLVFDKVTIAKNCYRLLDLLVSDECKGLIPQLLKMHWASDPERQDEQIERWLESLWGIHDNQSVGLKLYEIFLESLEGELRGRIATSMKEWRFFRMVYYLHREAYKDIDDTTWNGKPITDKKRGHDYCYSYLVLSCSSIDGFHLTCPLRPDRCIYYMESSKYPRPRQHWPSVRVPSDRIALKDLYRSMTPVRRRKMLGSGLFCDGARDAVIVFETAREDIVKDNPHWEELLCFSLQWLTINDLEKSRSCLALASETLQQLKSDEQVERFSKAVREVKDGCARLFIVLLNVRRRRRQWIWLPSAVGSCLSSKMDSFTTLLDKWLVDLVWQSCFEYLPEEDSLNFSRTWAWINNVCQPGMDDATRNLFKVDLVHGCALSHFEKFFAGNVTSRTMTFGEWFEAMQSCDNYATVRFQELQARWSTTRYNMIMRWTKCMSVYDFHYQLLEFKRRALLRESPTHPANADGNKKSAYLVNWTDEAFWFTLFKFDAEFLANPQRFLPIPSDHVVQRALQYSIQWIREKGCTSDDLNLLHELLSRQLQKTPGSAANFIQEFTTLLATNKVLPEGHLGTRMCRVRMTRVLVAAIPSPCSNDIKAKIETQLRIWKSPSLRFPPGTSLLSTYTTLLALLSPLTIPRLKGSQETLWLPSQVGRLLQRFLVRIVVPRSLQ